MNSKNDVLNKLNALLAYSVGVDAENADKYTALMQPLITAVNEYFNNDRANFKVPLNNLELGLYNDILKTR